MTDTRSQDWKIFEHKEFSAQVLKNRVNMECVYVAHKADTEFAGVYISISKEDDGVRLIIYDGDEDDVRIYTGSGLRALGEMLLYAAEIAEANE